MESSGVDVGALILLVVLCVVVFAVGVYSSRATIHSTSAKQVILANRRIGAVFGCFTMTATWVGGGFINGTAEQIYKQGLLSCQVPFAASLCLSVGGFIFARRMRNMGYMTMMDPIQERYGEACAMALSGLSCICDLLYSAAIMLALGSTISVIIGLDRFFSICGSALAVVIYTTLGGMNSVVVTDVVQLCLLIAGLGLCIPFAYIGMNDSREINATLMANSSSSVTATPLFLLNSTAIAEVGGPARSDDWLGVWPNHAELPLYLDTLFMIVIGGYAVQSYFQRVLSATSAKRAELLSYCGSVGCFAMAILPVSIGVIAVKTNWSNTDYGHAYILEDDYAITLPLVLKHLTPRWVSALGLAAVAAAVMSSADSTLLGLAVVTSRHIYTPIRNLCIRIIRKDLGKEASEVEKMWVLRLCVPLAAVLVVYTSLSVNSVYDLIILCGDLNYVLLLPQLVVSVYVRRSNTYGSACAIVVGCVLRILCGEPKLGLPVMISIAGHNPYIEFPFRSICMLSSMAVLLIMSAVFEFIMLKLPKQYDVFNCFNGEYLISEIDDGIGECDKIKDFSAETKL